MAWVEGYTGILIILDWWMISPSGFIKILNRREEDIIKCSIPHQRNLRWSHFLYQYWLELGIKQGSPISNSKQLVKKNGTESHWEIEEPFWLYHTYQQVWSKHCHYWILAWNLNEMYLDNPFPSGFSATADWWCPHPNKIGDILVVV